MSGDSPQLLHATNKQHVMYKKGLAMMKFTLYIKLETFAITPILLSMTALANTPTAHAQEPRADWLTFLSHLISSKEMLL